MRKKPEIKKVAVIGSLNVDHILKVDELPSKGQTLISGSYDIIEGGKGANQAVAISKMGLAVGMIGKVGEDESGKILIKSLKNSKVGIGGIIVSKSVKTGAAFITVDKDGNNTIIVAPGANCELSIEDIIKKEKQILDSDIVVLQLEIPVGLVSYVINYAKEKDKLVVLNFAPAMDIHKEVLAKVDYLIMNEVEFQFLTGREFRFDSLAESVKRLREFFNNYLVITLGEKGSVCADRDAELLKVPSFRVKAVDSTGAGDAFVGGFILGIIQNRSMKECLQLGNAAGAVSVTKLGAQTSLPDRNEIESFLNKSRFSEDIRRE